MSHECLFCGACCFSDSDAYIDVSAADAKRLREVSDEAHALVHEVDGARYMKMVDGHCAALTFRAGRFVCSVYQHRPAVCRALDRGSVECFAERSLKRARALRVINGPAPGSKP